MKFPEATEVARELELAEREGFEPSMGDKPILP